MARSETVRRIKSYSAATGYVYQYYFFEIQKTRRGDVEGSEYIYMVSADRKKAFPLRVFITRDAAGAWAATNGRPLSGTEEYAVAKIRLFQALDEIPDIGGELPDFVVDQSNLDSLLAQLDI